MRFEPVTYTLKNGCIALIREAHIADAEELRKVVKEYVEESEYIPYAENEFNVSLEDEKKWIQSFPDTKDGLLLLAVINNRIVGNISLNVPGRKMMKHTGALGIGILKEWRGNGVGTALFESVIRWAEEVSSLEFLWLETYATNIAGKALYEKFGFQQTGVLPRFVKTTPDTYVDSIIMSLPLYKP